MRLELLVLAIIVGFFTWLFRFAPTRFRFSETGRAGFLRRFLAATGPAAIATLFTASVLPMLSSGTADPIPLAFGSIAVIAVYFMRPSVVLATLAGAICFGLGTLLGG